MQKIGFLKILAPLLKSGLPLLKSVTKPLGMLGLTAAASATDAAINRKILGLGGHTTLIISNDDLNDPLEKMKLKRKKVALLVCYLVHLLEVEGRGVNQKKFNSLPIDIL